MLICTTDECQVRRFINTMPLAFSMQRAGREAGFTKWNELLIFFGIKTSDVFFLFELLKV